MLRWWSGDSVGTWFEYGWLARRAPSFSGSLSLSLPHHHSVIKDAENGDTDRDSERDQRTKDSLNISCTLNQDLEVSGFPAQETIRLARLTTETIREKRETGRKWKEPFSLSLSLSLSLIRSAQFFSQSDPVSHVPANTRHHHSS